MEQPLLSVDGIRVRVSSLTILRGLSLAVPAGAIIGLAGRNGAGKTTTLRAIMGLAPIVAGSIRLGEHRLESMDAHRRARLGIGYLPEDRRLVGPLSVRDNLLVPAQACGEPDPAERLRRIFDLLPELRELEGRRATALSGGQQKLVALGRSFMIGRRLLLLDEPFEGVSPALSHRLARVVREFQQAESGLAVLVAESDLKRVAMLAARAFVIERGEIVEEVKV
jgi:branched-chain amino acid transport system ATP-binding protein